MTQDNKKSARGKDVKALFGALGIDSDNYQNSAHENRVAKAEKEAEARWPLLSELHESYSQHVAETSFEEAAPEQVPAPKKKATQKPATAPKKAAPRSKSEPKAKAASLVDELASESGPTPKIKRKVVKRSTKKTTPKPAKPVATESEPVDETLAQVFGIDKEVSPTPAAEQADKRADKKAETPPASDTSAPADAEVPEIHMAHPPTAEKTQARHQPELEAVFSRLRKKPDLQTGADQNQRPESEPALAQPKPEPEPQEKPVRESAVFSEAESQTKPRKQEKSSVLSGLISRFRRRK